MYLVPLIITFICHAPIIFSYHFHHHLSASFLYLFEFLFCLINYFNFPLIVFFVLSSVPFLITLSCQYCALTLLINNWFWYFFNPNRVHHKRLGDIRDVNSNIFSIYYFIIWLMWYFILQHALSRVVPLEITKETNSHIKDWLSHYIVFDVNLFDSLAGWSVFSLGSQHQSFRKLNHSIALSWS